MTCSMFCYSANNKTSIPLTITYLVNHGDISVCRCQEQWLLLSFASFLLKHISDERNMLINIGKERPGCMTDTTEDARAVTERRCQVSECGGGVNSLFTPVSLGARFQSMWKDQMLSLYCLVVILFAQTLIRLFVSLFYIPQWRN